jgi:hypothetical protein
VIAALIIPVSRLMASTETPGMTPPDSSVMTPEIVAVVSCAKAGPDMRTMREKKVIHLLDIVHPFLWIEGVAG